MAEAVAPETRSRGSADAKRAGRLTWFIALAALLHVPFTPLGGFIGLLGLLHAPSHEAPPDTLNAIPIALLSPEELAQMGGAAPTAPPPPEAAKPAGGPEAVIGEPAPAPPKPKPKPKPKPLPEPADAGRPEGGSSDGGAPAPAVSDKPEATPPRGGDGGVPAPLASSTPPASAPDPMALVGKAASVADSNANVKLLLMNDRIRDLPIAPRIGRLVSRLPQWDSFFGPTKLDPIRDIERMYVAGPQFRATDDVVAVLQYRVSTAAMHAAIDAIVHRPPKGEWLDSKIPAAHARADRAERVFVLPKGKTLLMVPPHLADEAIEKAAQLSLPAVKGDAAVVAFVAAPWRALSALRIPLQFPKSIASVALTVTPAEDGGAMLHIDAVDESAESAQSHASILTTGINAVTQQNVGALGALLFGGQTLSLVEPVDLHADGKNIRGSVRVTPRELERLLGFAEAWVDSITGGPPPIPSGKPLTPRR